MILIDIDKSVTSEERITYREKYSSFIEAYQIKRGTKEDDKIVLAKRHVNSQKVLISKRG